MTLNSNCINLFKDLLVRDRKEKTVSFYSRKGKVSFSVGQLIDKIKLISSNLYNLLGKKNASIVYMLENSEYSVPLYLGCILEGATVIPLNPNSTPEDIEYVLDRTSPDIIVVSGSIFIPETYHQKMVQLQELVSDKGHAIQDTFDVNFCHDSRLIVHTSGTTGKPKGVVIFFDQVVGNARIMVDHISLSRQNQLTTLPMYHVHAIVFGIFSSLVSRSHLVIAERFNPIIWLKALKTERIEWTSVVPSLLPSLVAMNLGPEIAEHLKGVIVSSAPILEGFAVDFERKTGVPVLQAWGQSEFTCWATCCHYGYTQGEYHQGLRSVGTSLSNVVVSVRDEEGKELGELEEGELFIAGPFAMTGYYQQNSNDTVTPYGIRTGDVGYWKNIEGKPYYFISGRKKEIINRSGEKYSPVSIEEKIYEQYPDAFSNVAVVGFPHNILGEEIGIAVVNRYLSSEDKKAQFVDYLANLHDSIRPRIVRIIDEDIQMTPTGKIKRPTLIKFFKNFSDTNERFSVV